MGSGLLRHDRGITSYLGRPGMRRAWWTSRLGGPRTCLSPCPDNEQFFPGQPRQLYDLLPGEKQNHRIHPGAGSELPGPQHLLAGAVRRDRHPRLHPGENDDRWLATWGAAGVGIILGLIILVLVPVIPFTE